MLSRVADSIFWMSRYMERSNFLLRVVKAHYIGSQEDIQSFNWVTFFNSYGKNNGTQATGSLHQILEYLILEKENLDSVYNNIARARENARAIQDHITKEVWQSLNDYYHMIRESNVRHYLTNSDPVTGLDIMMRQSMMFDGMVDSTMSRGEGFNFLYIGRFLERTLQSTNLLLSKLSEARQSNQNVDTPTWRYFLFSLSGYEMYLKTNGAGIRPNLVIEQAVQNTHFPHSLLFSIHQVNRYFQRLHPDSQDENFNQIDFQIGKTISLVTYTRLNELDYESIINFLNKLKAELLKTANKFNKHYFGTN